MNHNLRIGFVFLRITLSNFCEICESKLSLCKNFSLHENNQVSVYTSILTIRLCLTPKRVKLYYLILITFWPPTSSGSNPDHKGNPTFQGILN